MTPTFHVADLTLTVRPLLVSVHFIRRKKLRSGFGSFAFLEPKHTRNVELELTEVNQSYISSSYKGEALSYIHTFTGVKTD